MSATIDPQSAAEAIMARLAGSGGPFELVEEEVLGSRLPVFKNRARSLGEVLADSRRHGDRDYIVTMDRRISFAEHAGKVTALAAGLHAEYGVGKGDRVAIAAANSPEWIETFWAAVALGAIAVGFNAWWSRRETAYGIEHAAPTLVVADAKRAALAEGAAPRILPVADLAGLAGKYAGARLPQAEVHEDDPAVILYTSGTSGRPKGAVHSHRNLCSVIEYHRMNDALAAAFGDPADPRDKRYLLALPLFHIASLHNLAVPRLATGSTVVMHQGAFDVDKVLSLIERRRVTNWGAVPTMAHRLLEHGDISRYDTSSLTAFALASAPSSPAFKQRLREALPFARQSLADSYGLTETCTAIAVASPMDLARVPGTLGRPIIGVQLEIRDAMGHPLPDGEEGEVCARSAFNMLGYLNDAEATARTIREDRWLHTGDIGVIEQGQLRLSSRRSDLIIRGGENVYPAEVEAVLSEHPAVRECVVLGVPHEDLGQEVLAVVVTSPQAEVTGERLREFAAGQLAYYKVPSQWRITHEALPRNATGKIMRSKIEV
ncbi:MAG TPA: class I adenylate-forming enzyme family protein [Streptosporangiaceae bacterium]